MVRELAWVSIQGPLNAEVFIQRGTASTGETPLPDMRISHRTVARVVSWTVGQVPLPFTDDQEEGLDILSESVNQ